MTEVKMPTKNRQPASGFPTFLKENVQFIVDRGKTTREEISERLGITRQTLSKFENGRKGSPRIDFLQKLADMASELVTGTLRITADDILYSSVARIERGATEMDPITIDYIKTKREHDDLRKQVDQLTNKLERAELDLQIARREKKELEEEVESLRSALESQSEQEELRKESDKLDGQIRDFRYLLNSPGGEKLVRQALSSRSTFSEDLILFQAYITEQVKKEGELADTLKRAALSLSPKEAAKRLGELKRAVIKKLDEF